MQDERPFVSCKKVMMDMGEPYSKHELLSFHTISKGALGECGLRGGYVEATNIHPGTIDQIYKIASINLSPNTTGQVHISVTGHASSSERRATCPGAEQYQPSIIPRGACKSVELQAFVLTEALIRNQAQVCCASNAKGIPHQRPLLRNESPLEE